MGSQNVADSNNKPADRRSLEICRTSLGVTAILPRQLRAPPSRDSILSPDAADTQGDAPQSMPRHSELVHDMSQSRTQFLIAVLAGSVGSVP